MVADQISARRAKTPFKYCQIKKNAFPVVQWKTDFTWKRLTVAYLATTNVKPVPVLR